MTCDWELYMGASLSSLASRDLGICSLELSENEFSGGSRLSDPPQL
jgi:hypothetical protein